MKKSLYVAAGIVLMSLMSCSSEKSVEESVIPEEENTENVYGEEEAVEVRGPITLTAREQAVNEAAADFALDYFRFNTAEGYNCVVSPLSLNGCLALIANGASGTTRTEIVDALDNGRGLTFDDCNSYWKVLSRDIPAVSANDKIAVVNSVWSRSSVRLKDSYLSEIKSLLLADHNVLAKGSVKDQINKYVEKKSRGMIQNMLEDEPYDSRVIFLNTLYFNSIWTNPFIKTPEKKTFNNIDRSQTAVEMMETENHKFRYAADSEAQYVILPFGLHKFEMLMVLPQEGIALDKVVSGINAASLSALNEEMDYADLIVKMPLFTIESKDSKIIDFLKSRGVTKAFDRNAADFSNLFAEGNSERMWVDMMLQKSKVVADETGFTGASATLGSIEGCDIGQEKPEPVIVNADRPFAFVVREVKSGIIIFIGQVTKL